MAMHSRFLILLLASTTFLPFLSSSRKHITLNQGSSLSSPRDVLVSSPIGIFTAGFYPVGENAYCFAIWFDRVLADGTSTVVWMANRDQPVNGRNTRLSLLHSGNLVLEDAGQYPVWQSGTESASTVQLQLHDNGNLVLGNKENATIWQSFDHPTDTLLPEQPLIGPMNLTSSRSPTNYSSGFYKFYFDNDNVLRLLYEGVEITSEVWPSAWLSSWEAGRSTYNTSKIAMLDLYGRFVSTDDLEFRTWDHGIGPQRRMILDPDGLLRVYSLNKDENIWEVTWQVEVPPCSIHGICGANSLCTYSPDSGRHCSCLPGYKMKNSEDWSEGCVPDFNKIPCDADPYGTSYFVKVSHSEFYDYDIKYIRNRTIEECERLCMSYCDCKGFQYRFNPELGFHSCYLKSLLFNGYQSPEFPYWTYIRLPKPSNMVRPVRKLDLQCTSRVVQINRVYQKKNEHASWKALAWTCLGALGAIEVICLLAFSYKTRQRSRITDQGLRLEVVTGFRRFTYAELKKASRNFSEEIGRGGSAVVYKGTLPDNRIAAIKCLNEANQGEAAEFLAEVGTIGRLNHANLIERWGYCAEGKHRILVYEYLENGSLAENLLSDKLDWRKRFDIALGTAKGLAYLHDECLEWVLHCDVKPHNILLDSDYQPKVADFGLSKQVKRSSIENVNVSTIRGTRGYMAPEWVYNLPVTSKVDVYSYGVVVLEMVAGKNPKDLNLEGNNGAIFEQNRLKNCVRKLDGEPLLSCIEKIVDPGLMGGEYDVKTMENLVEVALQCVQENRDARPTMIQVVDMLLGHGAPCTLG